MDISQLFMIGIPADGDLSAVKELQPGGIILMGRNAAPPAELRRFTRAIKDELSTPPLISVDQEGGRVQRLVEGYTKIPPMRELGERGAGAVSIMAMNVAAELRSAGLNMNFAPVCDVPVHEGDTVIGHRAFSDDPIRASLLAAEYIRGAQPNILCCAKHFPGHGGVGVDSHKGLPVFDGSVEELRSTHLPPFRAAIGAGVGAIMVGHIAVPCLDDTNTPATLSTAITTGVLREELGFRGLIVTDDLEMGALKEYSAGDIAVRAMKAGCDLLLFCHNADKAREAKAAIEEAVASGVLPREQVEASLERVAWAKRRFGITQQ
jgi:beta-N-acetylhexosaminidase